jgi:hypothetical protein
MQDNWWVKNKEDLWTGSFKPEIKMEITFDGVAAILLTPFDETGDIDVVSLHRWLRGWPRPAPLPRIRM